MDKWMRKNLGDPMLIGDTLEDIKALFLSEHNKSDRVGEMAIYIRHESEGRLHCDVIVYFSPPTSVVARAFNAVPCEKPPVADLDLLIKI